MDIQQAMSLEVGPRKSRRIGRKALRAIGGSLLSLSLILSSGPAYAGVEGEMSSFMSDMGVSANVSGPAAFQGQSAGYYTMGSVWSRFPQKNVQPFNLQLPHARAGCGGIDLFAGSFSYINTAELVAMLKATANNALGFAFKLAIDTISPEIGKVMDELAQKVQQMNQMNISSCETAQALVGGLWPKTDTASATICESIANSQGAVADWARARQQCNNGGQREALKNGNTDPAMKAQAGMKMNFTWHALNKKYSGFDPEFKEFLMTLVGTYIYNPDNAGGVVTPIGGADSSVISALLDGTSASPIKIWKCDEEVDCLNPTAQNLTITPAQSIKARVRVLVDGMATKVRNPSAPLSAAEVQLLGMASVPVYKIITVSAAAEFGVSPQTIDQLSEIVAVDLVTTMSIRFYDVAIASSDTFHGADAETLGLWREEMRESRRNFLALATRTQSRFDQTFQLIQRTTQLERTLRTQMSPQMTAAMRFSKSLSSQMQ